MDSSHIRRPETLEELPSDQLHDLTLCAVARVGTSHLELGNCLLAVERSEAFVDYGCSCMKHYAVAIGIGERLAREVLRVARRLEELPLMREAAEAGEVPWSNLREVVRVATPEHEEKWLEVATSYNSDIVQKLSGRANPGGPWPSQGPPAGGGARTGRVDHAVAGRGGRDVPAGRPQSLPGAWHASVGGPGDGIAAGVVSARLPYAGHRREAQT